MTPALAPLAIPERRSCPSELRRVIPSYFLSECEAMRKTLNEAERRALTRRFMAEPVLTNFGSL